MTTWLGDVRAIRWIAVAATVVGMSATGLFVVGMESVAAVMVGVALSIIPVYLYLLCRRAILVILSIRRELRTHAALQERLKQDVRDIERYIASSESVITGAIGEATGPIYFQLEAAVDDLASRLGGLEGVLRELADESVGATNRAAAELGGVEARLQRMEATAARNRERSQAQFDIVQSKLQSLRANIEQLPQSVGEYHALRSRLVVGDEEMPMLGGWALTSPTVAAIARRILVSSRPMSVLELGSGASTIWIALALRERGQGHCTTVEHLPEYAAEIRAELAKRSLSEWVSVVEAPLVDITIEGEQFRWYEQTAIPADLRVDILLVDGPPGAVSKVARFPALPLLSDRLQDDSWIVLDDTIREEEKRIAERWLERKHGALELMRPRSTGKSLIFEVKRV